MLGGAGISTQRAECHERRLIGQYAGFATSGNPASSSAIGLQPAQPLFMHVDPDRILIGAGRHFAKIEPHRVKRLMDAAMISHIFQNAVD